MLPAPPLLLITDRKQARSALPDVVAKALQGGCRWVMLREKDLAGDELRRLALELASLCSRHGARLLINGDIATARSVGADGVHLPAGASAKAARAALGAGAVIGASAHDKDELARAGEEGADYATLSPVFESGSKPGYGPALGLQRLRSLAADAPIPVVALGGVRPGRVAACLDSGAAGVAVMGAVMAAAQPEEVTRRLVDELTGPINRA